MVHKDSTYFWILKPDLNTNQKTKRKRKEGGRERRWRWKGGGGLTPRSTGYISSRCGAMQACTPSHHCLNTLLFFSLLLCLMFFVSCLLSFSLCLHVFFVSQPFWFFSHREYSYFLSLPLSILHAYMSVPLFLRCLTRDWFLIGWW